MMFPLDGNGITFCIPKLFSELYGALADQHEIRRERLLGGEVGGVCVASGGNINKLVV